MQTTQQKKEMVRIVDNSAPFKNHEDKTYLICLTDQFSLYRSWEIIIGRTEAYEYIKEEIDNIDAYESFILVEGCKLEERKSIYAFMKYASQFYEDNFDIDDHIYIEPDNRYNRSNNIDDSLNVDPHDRISMEDYMNGDIEDQEV